MDMMGELRRTHYNIEVRDETVGSEVTVAGFVARVRDLGNLIFCDLRDYSGILQLSFNDTTNAEVFAKAKSLSSESTVMAKGIVYERSSKNDEIPTGHIELFVTDLRILSISELTPFEIRDESNVRDELALRYRYLDIRRRPLTEALVARHNIVKRVRDFFDAHNFIEVETPMLVRSTPEGARDYIVPSRVHPGKVFALPQSPQLFKQLLMLSGIDRYFQIVRCFRDEDLRADRQPEFSQIDVEMAFCDVEDILNLNEEFIKTIFKEILNYDIELPLMRMTYAEAISNYGSDKPDTRFDLKLHDLSQILKNTSFEVFAGAIAGGGSVRAINAKGLADKISRRDIDSLVEFAKSYGAKGLAYSRYLESSSSSSFEKFLSESELEEIRKECGISLGDTLFLVADTNNEVVFNVLGALRLELAGRYGLIDSERFDLLWVTQFPLFEYSTEDERYYAVHHPFTAPMDEDLDILETHPLQVRAKAYDMVVNGTELGGGSIRISNPELQRRMFSMLSFTDEEMNEQFGFLIEAYRYGAPPHGGIAYGLDRLVMIMLKKKSIREVIAFPKVQSAADLMTSAPSVPSDKQLQELYMTFNLKQEE
ncbi:MAG: aspartate--tRNA ligase [Oscillospiraceae bacterium]|nr:aspartate--tRNA ligase [Oscillospiraceae bacterium]